jgi:hypothetical protein
MADSILSGPVDASCGGNSMNIHTTKIMDACRDKDCVEDLRVYPTVSSQAVIDSAFSVRPEAATLISADVNVDEIGFNRGYYTVDVTYFYLVTGETFPGGVPVRGLAVFDKRVILYGSEGSVKSFSSRNALSPGICGVVGPVAVVDAVDPIALNMRIAEPVQPKDTELRTIPDAIIETIGEDIDLSSRGRRLYVTLGQFSVIRLERDFQLSLGHADNYLPNKECVGSSDDDPCTLFSRVSFPVDEFIPPDSMPKDETYRDLV